MHFLNCNVVFAQVVLWFPRAKWSKAHEIITNTYGNAFAFTISKKRDFSFNTQHNALLYDLNEVQRLIMCENSSKSIPR